MKKYFFLLLVIMTVSCTEKKDTAKDSSPEKVAAFKPYWTCPMHPEIHKHEAGKCPICGMPLVEVKEAPSTAPLAVESEKSLAANQQQLLNSQIHKYLVKKGDLNIDLMLIGRMTSSKEITFQVYESDLLSLKTGLDFVGSLSSQPDQQLKGQVTLIDKFVDPSSRTIKVIGQLHSSIKNYITESTFTATIHMTEKNQILIPEDAVLHAGSKDLVYVFSPDNKLTSRKVVLGQKSQGQYQILSGLEAGESISTGANFLIDSEAKIRGL